MEAVNGYYKDLQEPVKCILIQFYTVDYEDTLPQTIQITIHILNLNIF